MSKQPLRGSICTAERRKECIQDMKSVLVNKWISVKDRLPEEGVPVLICTSYNKFATVKCYTGDDGHIEFVDWMRVEHTYGSVTHWRPLPEPPEENNV